MKNSNLLEDHAERIAGNIKTLIQTQFLRVLGLWISQKNQEFDGVSSGLVAQLAKKMMGDVLNIFKKKSSAKEKEFILDCNTTTSDALKEKYLPKYLYHITGGDCILNL